MITDRLAIVDLINRYFATDAKDWDAVADFYTDDATVVEPAGLDDRARRDRRVHARCSARTRSSPITTSRASRP